MGHYGPSQTSMMTQMLLMASEGNGLFVVAADVLNELGKNVFYIKPNGEEPKLFCESYPEWAEIEITKLVAAEKEFETNIPFNWKKLEDLKRFFSEATVVDDNISVFGNTGESNLCLKHPSYETKMEIKGNVSRSFLKKFCQKYESKGESEFINFSHSYGGEELPDFKLWRK